MKRHFDDDLKELHDRIQEMGELTEKAIARSIDSLSDASKARPVIEEDVLIDRLELVIDNQCIDLIARHQPVARDLRFVTTGMKINAEIERIADLAVDIAERALELNGKPLLKPLVDIPALSRVAQRMMHMSIRSFINADAKLAREVLEAESESDLLRDKISDELLNGFMLRDASTSDRALPLLLVARHLERICDHCTNIAEDVIYLAEGTVARHSPTAGPST